MKIFTVTFLFGILMMCLGGAEDVSFEMIDEIRIWDNKSEFVTINEDDKNKLIIILIKSKEIEYDADIDHGYMINVVKPLQGLRFYKANANGKMEEVLTIPINEALYLPINYNLKKSDEDNFSKIIKKYLENIRRLSPNKE